MTSTEDTGRAPKLAIHLFGPFEVRCCGLPLPRVPFRKGHWLLALLTLRQGREVERAWLAGTLWPNSPQSQALASLRNCLKDLRDTLGPESDRLYSPQSDTLALKLSGAYADVLAFDAAIIRGDTAALEHAVSLYRGTLLEECTEEWAFADRQLREQRYLNALETLAARALECGDLASAERWLRLTAAADPLKETAHRALMQLLAAGGDHAAALQVYRDIQHRLQREFALAPEPQTTALFAEIETSSRRLIRRSPPGNSNPDPKGTSLQRIVIHRPALPVPPTPLVGREDEIAALAALLHGDERRA